ncbi:serine protease inhibitor [Arthrobacter sp. NPDC090010]|uniref:serine protease inhibitor n=1 Tax=Arthrobacter sp. NPDC090010 TaxID=3363942 RepID=UPI0037FD4F7F
MEFRKGTRSLTAASRALTIGALLMLGLSACGSPATSPSPSSGGTAPDVTGSPTPTPSSAAPSMPETSSSPGTSTSPGTPSGADAISLTVARVDQPGAATVTLRLECRAGKAAAGSTVPDPAAACALLNSQPGLLGPAQKPGTACTDLYGGPETARVTGTLNGKPVEAKLSRTNGCSTAQWTALAPLLGSSGGV